MSVVPWALWHASTDLDIGNFYCRVWEIGVAGFKELQVAVWEIVPCVCLHMETGMKYSLTAPYFGPSVESVWL